MENKQTTQEQYHSLNVNENIWPHFFTVAPLVVIGSREGDEYDFAPKHMATPLGYGNYFGFMCTPEHATFRNVKATEEFTVSFPRPDQSVLASLAASPRSSLPEGKSSLLAGLPTSPAKRIRGHFIANAYLQLECALESIAGNFNGFSLIAGKVVAAHLAESAKIISDQDHGDIIRQSPLLAYLPHGRIAVIKDSSSFPFPRDFKE